MSLLIKAIATDIDGTLTETRNSYRIDPKIAELIRSLEHLGVSVIIVSSNALPVAVGVARYLGIEGPTIGESGCLMFYDLKIKVLTKFSANQARKLVAKEFGQYLAEKWHNAYRYYDFAFQIKKECNLGTLLKEIENLLRRNGITYVKVGYSGYSIHLTPSDVDKGKALIYACRSLGIDPKEVVAIGDSSMDIPMLKTAGFGVATADADEDLKNIADFVTSNPSGKGFIELVRRVIRGDFP